MKRKHGRPVITVFVLFLLIFSGISLSFLSDLSRADTGSSDADGDGLFDWQEELMGTDKNDSQDPGLYCMYEESYRTKNYWVWNNYSSERGEFWISTDRVVIRRGTSLSFEAVNSSDISITPAKEDMDELSVHQNQIDIPEDNSIGKYVLTAEKGSWNDSLEIFVVFDPWDTGLSYEKRSAYAYDEDGMRDEVGYIYTTAGNLHPGPLHPFGDSSSNMPEMYEFALAGVGNTSDPRRAAVKLVRIVAQRNTAEPMVMEEYRDACNILFYEDSEVAGLTLNDAEALAMNGVNIDDLGEKSKTMNHWCDESAFALTGLLRSIGIPSRIVSLHPTKDTELMGHFISEAWFEDSLYERNWTGDSGGWFALDADEWNAEWWSEDPKFWMPMGECFSSRGNYGRVMEHLFRVNYRYEVDHYYILGTDPDPSLREITGEYKDEPAMELDHGKITKFKGRGAGDLYTIKVENHTKLTLTKTGGIRPRIYVNEDDFPALKVSYQGYPPKSPNKNETSKEVTLPPGEYYIGVYAPQAGDNSIEGNYGTYTLEVQEVEGSDDDVDEQDVTDEKNDVTIIDYGISAVLVAIWLLSFIILKKTR